jgi:hypothetical protein
MLEMPTYTKLTPAFHRHQLMVFGRYRGIIHVPTGFKLVLSTIYAFMLIHSCMYMRIKYMYMYVVSTHVLIILNPLPILVTIRSGRHGLALTPGRLAT